MKFETAIGAFTLFVVMYVCMVMFNAAYVNGLYVLGIVPTLGIFDIHAPDITYKMFIFMVIVFSAIKEYFKDYTKLKSDIEISTSSAKSFSESMSKLMTACLSSLLTKILILVILSISYVILF